MPQGEIPGNVLTSLIFILQTASIASCFTDFLPNISQK